MNRAEQLHWWRQGFQAGLAVGARERHDRGLALHHAAIAEFHAHRQADQQATTNALIVETVDILAQALLGADTTNLDTAA